MKSTTKETSEQELLLGNVNQTNNNDLNYELTERVEIEETPFTAIRMDNIWFLTLGKYRISEPMETLEEIKKDAFRADWFRIMTIMGVVIEEYNKKNNEENKDVQ